MCDSPTGAHITLATKDRFDRDLHKSLCIGRLVQFEFTNITSVRSFRTAPFNIPGQYTDPNGMRYYPLQWIFANVHFEDFEYATRFPPHVSIGCIGVQLNVDQVDEFTKHREVHVANKEKEEKAKEEEEKAKEKEEKAKENRRKFIRMLGKILFLVIILIILQYVVHWIIMGEGEILDFCWMVANGTKLEPRLLGFLLMPYVIFPFLGIFCCLVDQVVGVIKY